MTLAQASAALAATRRVDPAILLVNDDPGTLFALRTALGGLDAVVETASSGEQALLRLLKQDFCVILMDIMMPDMDGYETMRRIRADPRFVRLPLIALTANATPSNCWRNCACGWAGRRPCPHNFDTDQTSAILAPQTDPDRMQLA